ncbi:MAG: FG-GAP repeat domain-containing protein, partial [Limisphaerales bacterium]
MLMHRTITLGLDLGIKKLLLTIILFGTIGTALHQAEADTQLEFNIASYGITNSVFPAGDVRGLALGDVNGNGKPDIVATGGKYLTVLTNRGDGSFSLSAQYTNGVSTASADSTLGKLVLADLTGDGHLEIIAGTRDGDCCGRSISVWQNAGNGTFGNATVYYGVTNSFNLVATDLNGDGFNDVVVKASLWAAVLLGNGDGTLGVPTNYFVNGILASGDFNSDGKPDLIAPAQSSNDIRILFGNGDGSFAPFQAVGTVLQGHSIDVGDFDRDGNQDILVGSQGVGVSAILHGNGDGTFRAPVLLPDVASFVNYIKAADFDGDGWLDFTYGWGSIFVVNLRAENGEYRRAKNFTGLQLRDLGVADLDGDGRPDIVTAGGTTGQVFVLLNRTAPALKIDRINNTLSWPTWPGYVLESSSSPEGEW